MRLAAPSLRRLPALTVATALVFGAAVGLATSAVANPPGPHSPIGNLGKVTAVGDNSVRMKGWAADPDALTRNLRVAAVIDGVNGPSVRTSVAHPKVTTKYGTSATPGFDLTVPVPASGVHTVCAVARSVDRGLDRVLGCVTTPLGTRLSSAQLAAHDPSGVILGHGATATSMSMRGWVREPDDVSRRTTVVMYVDGKPARTMATTSATAGQVQDGSGPHGAFRFEVPVSSGSHIGCVWAVNVGFGDNTLLGCAANDTRGPHGHGAVHQSTVNKTVVATAKKQLGKPYVWGAEGPKTFDCSGLVMFSYAKAGRTTPRVAADQFAAARLIPASRAVPGDLVFYHDSVGQVFHVGIVTGPADSIAAIDPQEGVAHQHIWDTTATYGSFTHT